MSFAGLPWILQMAAQRGTGLLVIQPGLHKDLGVVLQRQAFRDPHVLPVYGSSELAMLPFPNRPDKVFAEGGTGFQVCPVGRGGNTSLVMAEKLASLGREVEGKKLAIIVSYPWFLRTHVWPEPYAGNFSELQATRIATCPDLGFALKHRYAVRMLQMPETLKERRGLEKALQRLSGSKEKTGWVTTMKMNWQALQGAQLLMQDYVCTVTDLLGELPGSSPLPDLASASPAPPGSLPGEQGKCPASAMLVHPVPDDQKIERHDDYFADLMATTPEWADFELLLDTLAHFKARPLVIAIPMDGTVEDKNGVSQHQRNTLYYDRLADMCAKRGFAFEGLPEHEHNPEFLHHHRSHVSNEGWPYINQLLDAFYHDRLIKKKPQMAELPLAAVSKPLSAPNAAAPAADDTLAHGSAGQTRTYPLPGGLQMTFCYCPPGSFVMGSPAEEAGHDRDETAVPVRITQGYWLAQTELTQAQWKTLKALPKTRFQGSNLPLENVSWEEARLYLKDLTTTLKLPAGWIATLPTEAQWEHACRAGTTSPFNFGSVLDGTQANCLGTMPYGTSSPGTYLKQTRPVASHPANPWGLRDMHGNVWEWCADWYAASLFGGTDPLGPSTGISRVVRGGSWSNDAVHCRSASRNFSDPNTSSPNVGFRPALVFAGGSPLVSAR